MSSDKSAKPEKASNKLIAKRSPEEVRKLLTNYQAQVGPKNLLKHTAELWSEYENAPNDAKKLEIEGKLNEKLEHASAIVALDNHMLVAEVLNKDKYRTLVIELCNQLMAEYECKTSSEKMLAQTAAWAYCRMLEYSAKLNGLTRQEYLSNEKNGYYSMLSREVDRCARQYLSAINTLKHFKQPPVTVTFKAQNAFVAQNQQINSDKKPKSEETKQ